MEIKICDSCGGEGKVKVNDPDIDTIPCERCNSTGRLYFRIYELEIPFGDKNVYYNWDEKIFNLIRESKKCQS